MKKNEKEALVALTGAIGLIVLLIPIFSGLYPFTYGLLGALIIWILTGVLKKYLGVKK